MAHSSTAPGALKGARRAKGDPERRAPAQPGTTTRATERWRRSLTAGGFLLPNVVLLVLFMIVPLIMAFVLSFQKLGPLGHGQYLAFNNYLDLAQDAVFWKSLLNTLIFTVCTVPVSMGLGFALALLLNGVLPGRALYRTIIFLPLVISGVATGVLGTWMFDQNNGLINKFITDLGLPGPHWQSSGGPAMTSVIIVTVWQRVGFAMLIYLAGLQGINPEVNEAAAIDGATGWAKVRRITFPLVGPSTFFLLIMNMIYSFQVFDTVWAMTRGGPGYATTTVVTYAYRTSFDEHGPQQLGYGAAVGVVIYLITVVYTVIQWQTNRGRDQTG